MTHKPGFNEHEQASAETMMSPQSALNVRSSSSEVSSQHHPQVVEEQQYRASSYSLLASLLRSPPEQYVLDYTANLAGIESQSDELMTTMSMLGLAAKNSTLYSIASEYHDLFIGLGRGELVPFSSWYLTGYLMEKPLALLRDDLAVLGFERDADTHEPEDHVAALCEVMALLINDQVDQEIQSNFFTTHMEPWFEQFFNDLSTARSAVFYRSVGRFGAAFTELERQYLSMKA